MKLYLVSTYSRLLKNTGGIQGSYATYREAFEKAEVGSYIHAVNVMEVAEIRSAGKMAVKLVPTDEE